MRARFIITLVVAATLVGGSLHAAPSRASSARKGAAWLADRQSSSGSFGANRADMVADSLAAVVAGRVGGKTVGRALDYIGKHGRSDATRGAFTGRIIAGIVAGGGDPSDFAGTDYEAILASQYDASSGAYDDEQLFPNLLAANGAIAAADDIPQRAVAYIASNACDGGGFGFDNACSRGPDVDTTSWAINVLVAAGEKGTAVVAGARTYLLGAQRSDGGFGFSASIETSADSTGLALTAIAALGEDPQKAPWRQPDGDDPVRALLRFQDASGGFSFAAGKKPTVLSTTNAVSGMAGVPYPVPHLAAIADPPSPTPKPTATAAATGAPRTNAPAPTSDAAAATSSPRRTADGAATARPTTPRASGEVARTGDRTRRGRDNASADTSGDSFSQPRQRPDGGTSALVWGGLGLGVVGAGAGGGLWWWRRRLG